MNFGSELYNNSDYDAIKILNDFLPEKIFDAHTHMFDCDFTPGISGNYVQEKSELEDYKRFFADTFGKRDVRLNIISHPDKKMMENDQENLKKSDEFLKKELEKDDGNIGEIVVLPTESVEDIEKRLVHPGVRGFKCYHLHAPKSDTFNCTIDEYLPESVWQVANERKMCITLHMVRDTALADEKNYSYIIKMAKKYPDAVLILAHAARSFASWTAIESVEKVADLENVWYDFSAVCESPAMFYIMKKAGVGKCMWGSDFPVCTMRGKAISLADTFYWIYQKDLDAFSSKTKINNWLIATENLMATRQACIMAGLSKSEVEDLFYNNAAKLFGRK